MRKYCLTHNEGMRKAPNGTEYCYSCWRESEKRRTRTSPKVTKPRRMLRPVEVEK